MKAGFPCPADAWRRKQGGASWRVPMGKKKQGSPFTGLWHIIAMSEWDEDYFNEEVRAFIEFEANGTGHFQSRTAAPARSTSTTTWANGRGSSARRTPSMRTTSSRCSPQPCETAPGLSARPKATRTSAAAGQRLVGPASSCHDWPHATPSAPRAGSLSTRTARRSLRCRPTSRTASPSRSFAWTTRRGTCMS
jgi:hypothetical protein